MPAAISSGQIHQSSSIASPNGMEAVGAPLARAWVGRALVPFTPLSSPAQTCTRADYLQPQVITARVISRLGTGAVGLRRAGLGRELIIIRLFTRSRWQATAFTRPAISPARPESQPTASLNGT